MSNDLPRSTPFLQKNNLLTLILFELSMAIMTFSPVSNSSNHPLCQIRFSLTSYVDVALPYCFSSKKRNIYLGSNSIYYKGISVPLK